jgi:hypothetical protein
VTISREDKTKNMERVTHFKKELKKNKCYRSQENEELTKTERKKQNDKHE